jgi:acetyl-CoA carboxylase carboxyltransferase component
MAMAAGGFHAPLCTIAWPSGEFGAMGLEGAVRLGFKKELAAQAEGPQREVLFAQLLAQQVDNGSAMNMAASLEIDAVIEQVGNVLEVQNVVKGLSESIAAADPVVAEPPKTQKSPARDITVGMPTF